MIIKPSQLKAERGSFGAVLYEDGKKVHKLKGTRDVVKKGIRDYFQLK